HDARTLSTRIEVPFARRTAESRRVPTRREFLCPLGRSARWSRERSTSMEMPRLSCSYPLRKSPHYESIKDEFHEWILSYGPFEDEQRKKKVTATDYPYLATVCWRACNRRRLWDIAALACALTERDSEYDAARHGASLGGFRASAADTRAHYRVVTEPRWGPLFADVWQSLSEYVPVRQMSRLADVVA